MYDEILDLIDQRKLKEGLKQLKAAAEKADNWNYLSAAENLQANYEYMLKYASEGKKDPYLISMYNDLVLKIYELTDELQFDHNMSKSYGGIADKYRSYKLKPAKTFIELQEELVTLNKAEGINMPEQDQDYYCHHEYFSPHCEFIDEVFNKTVTSLHWSNSEYEDAYELLYKGMSVFDIEVWLSAITLSLLNYFDIKKFNFLLNVYLDKNYQEIKCRALVGILLTFYTHGLRISLYQEDMVLLNFLLENEEEKMDYDLYLIQLMFLFSRETEKINKKMRDEILPQMLKNPYLKYQDRKFEEIELSELEEDNPNWEKDLNKISKSIQELGELQREGADTYMSTFAILKHYKFFNETAHWFYPYNKDIPAMASILKEKDIKDNSILSSMLNSPAFCNSDKYSFTLALNEIPLQQMNMMEEDVQGREEILNDQLGVSQNISDQENKKVIYRQYIHDLYRFFKLWNFRKQVDDIFTSPLTFWSLSTFKSHFTTTRYGKEIADHLLSKGYYEEAISLYTYLTQEEPTNIEFLQKAGFAHQKNEKYEKALDFYKKGFILDPLDLWTIKHIALCYRKMHKDQDALDFFKMAERHDPDNLNITLQIGHCLTSLFEFDEALKYFFKVEYLSQAKVSAHRAIAWCYFMTDKIEKAAHYYEKIIQESTPIFTDWLNYGHVFLVQEDIPNAVSCYKKAMALCESCKDLDDIILDDTPILMSKGVDEVILAITEDLVETNN